MPVPSPNTERPRAARDAALAVDVLTGSRLHFGLLRTGRVAGIRFGGVGAMIRRPRTWVEVRAAEQFRVEGPGGRRASEVARRWQAVVGLAEPPRCAIRIRRRAPAHAGLGSGTQLALAVAAGLSAAFDRPLPPETLAVDAAGRGGRSAIGLHGFFRGGLLVESGLSEEDRVGRLQDAVVPPAAWRIVLARPTEDVSAVFGEEELQRFKRLAPRSVDAALERLVTRALLPAAQAGDFPAFARAVTRFNHDAGMLFAEVQGGPYNGTAVSRLVDAVRRLGTYGVGQSSWGPTVFACCPDADRAEWLVRRLQRDLDLPPDHLAIARFERRGARIRRRADL